MTVIDVALKDHSYQVHIERGLLNEAGHQVKAQWPKVGKVALISDDNVAPLYQQRVAEQLMQQGLTVCQYVVPAGEPSKSWPVVNDLVTKMIDDSFSRDDGVVALGGGVIGDLAGFVASVYMRGIAFIQIPTSLLAQVDSSVGGKTAIDVGAAKNMVGTFYQPDLVLIDPDTLDTLPERYLVEGYGEIVKTALLDSAEFWNLTEQVDSVVALLKLAPELSQRSIAYKAKVVMADEKEGGLRQVLNLGHTAGHAIELLSPTVMAHGEAVSIGLVKILRVFEAQGLEQENLSSQVIQRLQAVGLPTESELIGTPAFYETLQHDKKNRGGVLNLVYVSNPGEPHIYPIDSQTVKTFFEESCK
ncbi:3-dehydroquinate synthase [Furfurilactobacillus siliginis]|uniref:3-dehydroquinate synthase n=1 Tax=Furfurilactobacillus siliginis TaxID=348151 RepID=A0A0R2L7J5_9LACO|nr:3-dehydroquinate synthase [Furfurilactobacillus siliginis]KRN95766.1 3-dehydroquinate synthase [Furfurilactobacillus siliginis]GEK28958.1 3-dehydroquinate synthase [Furfurilactobacillus siliginis]